MSATPPMSESGDDLENALHSVERVLAHQSSDESLGDVSGQFSAAVRCVVQLRNRVTAAHRAGSTAPGTPSLGHVNALLSLMAGIEYPLAGIHWPRIQQVSDDLRKMLAAQKFAQSRQAG